MPGSPHSPKRFLSTRYGTVPCAAVWRQPASTQGLCSGAGSCSVTAQTQYRDQGAAAAEAQLSESAARLAEASHDAETPAPHAATATQAIRDPHRCSSAQIEGAWAREYEPARAAAETCLAGPRARV
jgi:hypothetical protein